MPLESNRFKELAEGVMRLCGADGSPYSNKIRSLLLYRRLPFRWLSMSGIEASSTPNPPGPPLLPKLVFEDGSVMNDSTFLIKELERRHPGARSVIPPDPALAFLCALLEDFSDEWMTKAMFHYRWTYDIQTAGYGIGLSLGGFSLGLERAKDLGATMAQRQVARLHDVVGSNEVTAPIIERSLERVCGLLEAHLHAGHDFLLGSRPSAADFALFGQLHPMISLDVETSRKVFAASRSVFFWYHSLKDLSGLSLRDESTGWFEPCSLPPTLLALFAEVGRLYAPFMVANARAIAAGQTVVECTLDGGRVPWKQASFKYQAKCLGWLREEYAALSPASRETVDAALASTGCHELLHAPIGVAKL